LRKSTKKLERGEKKEAAEPNERDGERAVPAKDNNNDDNNNTHHHHGRKKQRD